MWPFEIPAFIFFFIAGVTALLTQGTWRTIVLLGIVLLGWCNLGSMYEGFQTSVKIFGYDLIPFRVDSLSMVFGHIFHLAAVIGIIYSLHEADKLQLVSALLYAGSGVGAVFAGDLLSLFIFWEFLAITSVFLIWARRTERAYRAGLRCLIIQVLSGVILLAGGLVYHAKNATLEFGYIGLTGLAGWLIFVAFGIKACFPFVHTWLTDAYPEATPVGAVFLSAYTTKVAVYCLARGYPGTEVLLIIGAVMTCFPIFFAVIENDLRRVLTYSMINQLGYMVCGIGIGTSLAINGTCAHAFAHILYKGLLFMAMGAVLHMTGRINGSELGGLYKCMPKTTLFCVIGAASISAFPLFSGFVSKSMVMTAALQQGHEWIWLMLLFASAGVFHHAGIKIPYFAFFAHDSGIRCREAPNNMQWAMFIAALVSISIGVAPKWLYNLLPFEVDYSPYDVTHVITQAQLLFFSALAFVWLNLRGLYPPELRSVNLDVDWFYRRLLPNLINTLFAGILRVDGHLRKAFLARLNGVLESLNQMNSPGGNEKRTRPTGVMVIWVAILLAAYLWLLLSFQR